MPVKIWHGWANRTPQFYVDINNILWLILDIGVPNHYPFKRPWLGEGISNLYQLCSMWRHISLKYPVLSLCCEIRGRAYIDWLVQERCNSIANTLELRLSCTNLSIYICMFGHKKSASEVLIGCNETEGYQLPRKIQSLSLVFLSDIFVGFSLLQLPNGPQGNSNVIGLTRKGIQ